MSAERQNEFLEFVKIIGEMSEDEIIALEKERNQEAYLTSEDYKFLAARGYWNVDEACGFLLNIDKRRTMIMDCTSSGYTRTFGARYFEIFHAYLRCVNIGEIIPETIDNQEALAHGVDDIRTIVVLPKDFLLWAKSKGLPIPPMLWSAVFTPEEFALESYRDGNVEIPVNPPISRPLELVIKNVLSSGCGMEADATESNNQKGKDQVAVKRGTKTGHKIRDFKKVIKDFVEDEKTKRGCTCNHLMLAEYIKKMWSTLMPQLYGQKDPKTIYKLNKEPIEYIVESCCEAFKYNNWPRVKNKDEGRIKCKGVPQHTEK